MKRKNHFRLVIPVIIALCLVAGGCAAEVEVIDRESRIPPTQQKITPATDLLPPILHSDEYEEPVPMPYPINTAGAEDSGFVMPDGNTFYVWFTPDPNAPLGEQLNSRTNAGYPANIGS